VAGKQERQRRLARERYERRLARATQRQQAMRKMTAWVAGAVVLLVVAGVVTLTVLHLGKSASAQGTPSATPSVSTPSASPTPSPTPTPTPPATEPATSCDYVPSGTPARPIGGLPPATPDSKATYTATIKTNRGDIVIDLLNSKATCTVNSFVFLASKNYFSTTHCHRLTTSGIYVLQCGDPTGTGAGGPGYEFANENLATAKTPTGTVTYTPGTVAMANAGPGTNGSQFFLVYKNSPLQPAYTPFGTIVSGLNILQDVAKAGVAAVGTASPASDGPPKDEVIIESVIIKKT
jgi:peptidyl-prolyl cis-trans isomerase B (cyclophilin B)